jgi:hypothetical protein
MPRHHTLLRRQIKAEKNDNHLLITLNVGRRRRTIIKDRQVLGKNNN